MRKIVPLFAPDPKIQVRRATADIMDAIKRLQAAMDYLGQTLEMVDRLIRHVEGKEQREQMLQVSTAHKRTLSCATKKLNLQIANLAGSQVFSSNRDGVFTGEQLF